MKQSKQAAALSWLLHHAQQGELPEHLSNSDRDYVVQFLSKAIALVPEATDSQDLVGIAHSAIQGSYISA